MTSTVGDFLVERLYQWGIRRIFGYPGDGINGVFGALNRAEGKIEFVQARHEEMAAFMASAHAKFTGELGVCIATSGPGASHLLTGLYDARMDHQPVLAIVGQQAVTSLGSDYQQQVEQASSGPEKRLQRKVICLRNALSLSNSSLGVPSNIWANNQGSSPECLACAQSSPQPFLSR